MSGFSCIVPVFKLQDKCLECEVITVLSSKIICSISNNQRRALDVIH